MKYKQAISNKDKQTLKRATRIAETSTCNFQHAAIIVKSNSVISVGVNRNKTDPRLLGFENFRKSSVHAEIAAIKGSHGANLKGATIYVARVNRKGEQMMSKPCSDCQIELERVGIKKVYYTIESSMDL